ncbi:MAG TPA: TraR/DksA C4-type zinc finger protein [Woeseiaceae bacterium]|nr:TraR/DksA C4-type zinc finger protein [Woeseiaceae bacterium]
MTDDDRRALRLELLEKRDALETRLARIRANLTRRLDADSKERAKELEDSEVVNALGIEAIEELQLIRTTLNRLDEGEYGICRHCGNAIGEQRLKAWPYAAECIDCARENEKSAR